VGQGGRDMTNELTFAMLEIIDEMTPILEPKPNVRLHRKTPEALLDKVVEMVASSQGAPFLLNFDERSMAGMMREANRAGITHLINEGNVHEYAPVGCLENTMVGNDRSGTVDNNLNLLKAVEFALNNGRDLAAFEDPSRENRSRFGRTVRERATQRSSRILKNSSAPTRRRRVSSSRDALTFMRPRNRFARGFSRPHTFPASSKGAPRRVSTSRRAAQRSASPRSRA
jgi:hypothetical protein